VFLTLAALAGSVAFWVSATDTRPVLIALRDRPAGATLSGADLGIVYLRADDAVYRAALPGDMLDSFVGRQLAEPIHADQILARAQLADQLGLAADQVAITIPARPDSAVDGHLQPGDLVQILVTVTDKSRNEAHTSEVLDRAQVFEVGRDAPLVSSGAPPSASADAPRGTIATITLSVSVDQARQLAEARRTGELDVLLLPASSASRQ
jgi:Flp pilus assembly protein CpaB